MLGGNLPDQPGRFEAQQIDTRRIGTIVQKPAGLGDRFLERDPGRVEADLFAAAGGAERGVGLRIANQGDNVAWQNVDVFFRND